MPSAPTAEEDLDESIGGRDAGTDQATHEGFAGHLADQLPGEDRADGAVARGDSEEHGDGSGPDLPREETR
jgi:hypothetical protein